MLLRQILIPPLFPQQQVVTAVILLLTLQQYLLLGWTWIPYIPVRKYEPSTNPFTQWPTLAVLPFRKLPINATANNPFALFLVHTPMQLTLASKEKESAVHRSQKLLFLCRSSAAFISVLKVASFSWKDLVKSSYFDSCYIFTLPGVYWITKFC